MNYKLMKIGKILQPHIYSLLVYPSINSKSGDWISGGSCIIIDSGHKQFLLTAYHVYEKYISEKEIDNNSILLLCGGVDNSIPIDISNCKLIDYSEKIDLATVSLPTDFNPQDHGKYYYNYNCDLKINLDKGNEIFLVGYPVRHRESSDRGLELKITPICVNLTSVNEHEFSCADEEDKWQFIDFFGGLSALDTIAGMSGSPAFVNIENDWILAGTLIAEGPGGIISTPILKGTQIKFLLTDGKINKDIIFK